MRPLIIAAAVLFASEGRAYDSRPAVWTGHGEEVEVVAFSPDGRYALSGSRDDTLRLWEVPSGRVVSVWKGHAGDVCAVAFSPDGKMAVSGGRDSSLKLWEVPSGKSLGLWTAHEYPACAVAFSPDGKKVLSGSEDFTLRLWEVPSGIESGTWEGHNEEVRSVAFSPDGSKALSGGDDDNLRLWDVPGGVELAVWRGHQLSVRTVGFSPDGRAAVSGSADFTLKTWDVATGDNLATWTGHKGPVKAAAFSRDGRRIVSASDDGTVRLWDAARGAQLAVWTGHRGKVKAAAISPDSRYVLSGGEDSTVRLWDVAAGIAAAGAAAESPRAAPAQAPAVPAAGSPSGPAASLQASGGSPRLWPLLGLLCFGAAAAVVLWLVFLRTPSAGSAGARSEVPSASTGDAAPLTGSPGPLSDEVLTGAGRSEAEVDRIVALASSQGRSRDILDRLKGKPGELCTAFAKGFMRKNDQAGALAALRLKGGLTSQDYQVFVAAHRALGSLEHLELSDILESEKRLCAEALMSMGLEAKALSLLIEKRKGPLSQADYATAMRLCLAMDNFNLAERLYEDLSAQWDAKAAPDLHYYFGLVCEKKGRISLARTVYGKLEGEAGAKSKASERLRRLASFSDAAQPGIDLSSGGTQAWKVSKPGDASQRRVISEKYEIQTLLGVGGMGVVYKGLDRLLGRAVAIKKMNADVSQDEAGRAQFCLEARTVAKLNHPNIVSIFDIVMTGAEVFLVFELMDGETLAEVLASRGRLEASESVRVLEGVCEALAYAHSLRIIHRDVKPSNIMMDRRGRVKVMDFGLARQSSGRTITTTEASSAAGTLAYMAPEQHLGKSSERADIFALGATAYELLEGRLPFPGYDFLAQKQREIWPPFESSPEPLRALVGRCLKADPALRPGSAAEVLKELQALTPALHAT